MDGGDVDLVVHPIQLVAVVRDDELPEAPGDGKGAMPGDESLGNVGNRRGMPKKGLHKAFDGALSGRGGHPMQIGQT